MTRGPGWRVAVVGALLPAVAGCGPSHARTVPGPAALGPDIRAEVLDLPDNGTGSNDLVMEALLFGTLHVARTPAGACAWLGSADRREAALWPAGYRVRFTSPAELLDPQGRVVAAEGQPLLAGGGNGTTPRPSRCSDGRTNQVLVLQGDIRLGQPGSAGPG